ncbi:AzlC family ABC transporter permease [Litorivicinus lipolyticus]|uniref:AzlC family ABC transporter permease n=1 Tax=Litorivicinus lipolyticus TaxID=418701 RepID=UPI003B59931A
MAKAMRQGALSVLPFCVTVVPFGVAWAVAAQAAGLPDWMTLAMSAVVFAGASQFASLELLGGQGSLLAICLLTFAVNARHVLMGTTLYPDFGRYSFGRQAAMVMTLTDAPFALIQNEPDRAKRIGLIVAGGWLVWLAWVLGTVIGLLFGSVIGDPALYGFDAVMPVFFLVVLVSAFRGRRSLLPWISAAVVAIAWQRVMGGNWHVLVGAVVGGVVNAVQRK